LTVADRLEVRKVGNSLGVILPRAALDELNVEEGDELFIVHAPAGIFLTSYDPDSADAVEDAREFMRTHRNAFDKLAE
jgi:putative addiction module antidote